MAQKLLGTFLMGSKFTLNLTFRAATIFASSRSMSSGKKMVNGVELFYDSRGNGDHALVCIAGAMGTTKSDFAPQLNYFGSREGLMVVGFDPRGYGNSRPPKRHFSGTSSFEHDARDAKGLMDALNIKKFSVLGWSDGGISGMILAALFPDSIRSLVIWGANSYVSKEDIDCYEAIRDLSKWSQKMRDPLEQEYGKEGLHELWNGWCDTVKGVHQSDGNLCNNMLSDIKCPTLILHGMKDPMVPNFHPAHLLKNIKGSVGHNFPDGKHNIHLRYSEEFNKIVEDFVRKY